MASGQGSDSGCQQGVGTDERPHEVVDRGPRRRRRACSAWRASRARWRAAGATPPRSPRRRRGCRRTAGSVWREQPGLQLERIGEARIGDAGQRRLLPRRHRSRHIARRPAWCAPATSYPAAAPVRRPIVARRRTARAESRRRRARSPPGRARHRTAPRPPAATILRRARERTVTRRNSVPPTKLPATSGAGVLGRQPVAQRDRIALVDQHLAAEPVDGVAGTDGQRRIRGIIGRRRDVRPAGRKPCPARPASAGAASAGAVVGLLGAQRLGRRAGCRAGTTPAPACR